MKRIVKKTGFVHKNDIYTSEADEAFLVKVDYEEEVDVPDFGIAEALKYIAGGWRVLQLNTAATGTVAGPYDLYTLPNNYTNLTRFILE